VKQILPKADKGMADRGNSFGANPKLRLNMNFENLHREFREAIRTENFSDHKQFLKNLLSCNDDGVLQFHFDLLKEKTNPKLYYRVRAAFEKRGESIKEFLVEKIKNETDINKKVDAIQIISHLRAVD
jgi:hypothetical protein